MLPAADTWEFMSLEVCGKPEGGVCALEIKCIPLRNRERFIGFLTWMGQMEAEE